LKSKRAPLKLDALVTIQRTMQVFEMLADDVDGVAISDIARKLDVNKSIAFRIVATLRSAGYIYKRSNDTYRLTFRISNLGLRQQANARLTDQCHPVIRALADETGELIRLAIIERGKPIWVHAASGPQRRLRIDPVWHAEVVYHTHAVGKAWLSTLTDDQIVAITGPGPFLAQTRYSKTTLSALLEEITETRKNGVAISVEESELGVGAIATPIMAGHDNQRVCVAVVSIAAPTSRMDRASLLGAGEKLLQARHELEAVWPLDASRL
jgi:IclR family transcriptional regulator, acetate operon repressor